MMKIRAIMERIFSFWGQCAKISLEFTDSMPIFIDVSVNGNDFDKFSAAHHLLNHCT